MTDMYPKVSDPIGGSADGLLPIEEETPESTTVPPHMVHELLSQRSQQHQTILAKAYDDLLKRVVQYIIERFVEEATQILRLPTPTEDNEYVQSVLIVQEVITKQKKRVYQTSEEPDAEADEKITMTLANALDLVFEESIYREILRELTVYTVRRELSRQFGGPFQCFFTTLSDKKGSSLRVSW